MPVVELKSDASPQPRDGAAPAASPSLPEDLTALSLVQIAQRLDRITAQIEAERAREREARAHYERLAVETDRAIRLIKQEAAALLAEQRRRLSTLGGSLDHDGAEPDRPGVTSPLSRRHSPLATPANIAQAILRLWTLPEFDQPLSTDQIAQALPSVGYRSVASARSLRSAVNQALARLCRDGLIHKCRADGSIIPHGDVNARARKYVPTG